MESLSIRILRLLGRFHPTMIHFPIAFLLAAAALEGVGILKKKVLHPEAAFFCLSVGTAGALVSAPLGWLDAAFLRPDPGDAELLLIHRCLGTFAAAVSAAAWTLGYGLRRGRLQAFRGLFRVLVFLAAIAVGAGGHIGGLMVYGRDYYSSALAAPPPATAAGKEGRFEKEILPILRTHCLPCHGPVKQKSRLRLDSLESVLKGGKSGPAVLPGQSARSPLYRAIIDPDPDTRMPQEAPPLPGSLIDRIREWIDQGAR